MGFVDMDKDGLTGNSLTLEDLVITWDDDEELWLQPDKDGQKPEKNDEKGNLL